MNDFLGFLPIPERCDVCDSDKVKFVENKELYGDNKGEWHFMYLCIRCKAAVGCHNGTKFPLGKLANKRVRELRSKAHEAFDKFWKSGLMCRTKAYKLLSYEIEIDFSECHIGWLSQEQLKRTISFSNEYYNRYYRNLVKRKIKQDAKFEKRNRRNMRKEIRDFEKYRP